jgi:hypothetical protein
MDLHDQLIQHAVVIANHAHYMLYLSDSSLFLMKRLLNNDHVIIC